MTPAEHVYKALQDMGISYEVVEHPPALTKAKMGAERKRSFCGTEIKSGAFCSLWTK